MFIEVGNRGVVTGGWRRERNRVGSTGTGLLRGDKNVLRLDGSD